MSNMNYKKALLRNWQWFRRSGVMEPPDGSWGVAERVMLTAGNTAAQRTLDAFPAWTPHLDYCIIEQRRADCCMETSFLFFLLHKLYGDEQPFRKTAENLLEFLYFRSGLLNRKENAMTGTWDWSHIKRSHCIWFDDNAWMLFLGLKIARLFPVLDRKYNMKGFALKLADTLANDAPDYLAENREQLEKKEFGWSGKIRMPHWGSLVCMALAEAYRAKPAPAYRSFIEVYETHLLKEESAFTPSECAYALLGCTTAAAAGVSAESLAHSRFFADKIVSRMNPENGCIPSEHFEAPSGKGLADTIYTMNWALLGLQNMAELDSCYTPYYEKIAALLLDIQDTARSKHLSGCWRGMYDMENRCWGGGDCYEGGANSIYTGWTNAPISWGFALHELNTSLMKI